MKVLTPHISPHCFIGLPPLTQEEILRILGFEGNLSDISFGPFTGNNTIIKWFNELSDHFKVKGKGSIFWKVHGRNQTKSMNDERARTELKKGIMDPRSGYIYHCHNHYMVLVGFEESLSKPENALEGKLPTNSDSTQTHFLIGDSSRTNLPLHCVRFEDICKDLHCSSPRFFNIRHPHLGVQTRNCKSKGNNVNCIMKFENLENGDQISSIRSSLKQRILLHKNANSSKENKVTSHVVDGEIEVKIPRRRGLNSSVAYEFLPQ